jgi:hypothetical protein
MLMTYFICQTDLKPSSVTNGKNGAITPSLTRTMQARCYNAGKWGFPFSPQQCRQGRTRMRGGWVVHRQCVRCMQ